jgi:hypothetical protein
VWARKPRYVASLPMNIVAEECRRGPILGRFWCTSRVCGPRPAWRSGRSTSAHRTFLSDCSHQTGSAFYRPAEPSTPACRRSARWRSRPRPGVAQPEITCPDSTFESGRRRLKHQWLYLNTLDSVASVRRLVELFVAVHNRRVPTRCFGASRTLLVAQRKAARAVRLDKNRSACCSNCEPTRYAS